MRKVYFKKPYAFRTGWDAMTSRMFLSYRKEKGRRIKRPIYSIRQIWAARTNSFHAARHDARRQKPKPKTKGKIKCKNHSNNFLPISIYQNTCKRIANRSVN